MRGLDEPENPVFTVPFTAHGLGLTVKDLGLGFRLQDLGFRI